MKNKRLNVFRLILSLIITTALLVLEFTIGDVKIATTSVKFAFLLPLALATYFFISYDLYIKSFKQIKRKDFFNEVTLTLVASLAAIAIGEFIEGLAVTVFFQIGEKFESYAVNKSRESIKAIANLRPDQVTLIKNNKEIVVEPFDVEIGDTFIVKPGERVPIDGVVIKGNSSLDTSSMTGESIPRSIQENEEIMSGVINLSSPLIIKATKEFYNSTMSKILDLVENASSNKSKTEKFITKFSKIYTPIVIALAFIVALVPPLFLGINDVSIWTHWIRSGAGFLVISCPCALVLSVPMTYFVSLGKASKNKVLIKGSNYLDKFRKLRILVFDKTGTITKSNFEIDKIVSVSSYSENELLKLAQNAEFYSHHPIAKAISNVAKDTIESNKIELYEDLPGKGIKLFFDKKELLVGKLDLLKENGINVQEVETPFTIIYIAYDQEYLGYITIRDSVKETSKLAIKNLYKNGIKKTYMLTGDNYKIATSIAKETSITDFEANLLPLDKLEHLKRIKSENPKKIIAYCGDGVNDAPALSLADVGISMGLNGSDLAIESSDAVIMDDDLNKVNSVIKLSKNNHIIALENIIFAILTKTVVMILSLIPNLPISNLIMWFAIFADVGVTIICVLNSLRLMIKK